MHSSWKASLQSSHHPVRWIATSALGLTLLLGSAGAARANEVLDWNTTAAEFLNAAQDPLAQSRSFAMIQIAVHDALNAIDRRYQPYVFDDCADDASPEAAVATATRDVLVHLLPAETAAIDAIYAARLALIADGDAKDDGIELGHESADAIIALRSGDDPTEKLNRPYVPPSSNAGVYQATEPFAPFVLGVGWGELEPFALRRASQFRPRAPYSLGSPRYVRDYLEVKSLGDINSTTRTAHQSESANFWYESSSTGWMRIANVVSTDESLDAWESARVLGLVGIALADGFIGGFEAKHHYLFWRPITAIRVANDTNPRTPQDPTWTPFCVTPPVADYPSTHSVLGAAGAAVLASLFGDRTSFTIDSLSLPGVTRSYSRFSDAARENADSRVICGIHWRETTTVGVEQGAKIGLYSVANELRPVRHHH